MLSKLCCAASFMFSVAFVAVMSAHTSAMFQNGTTETIRLVVSILGWCTFISILSAVFFTVLESFSRGR